MRSWTFSAANNSTFTRLSTTSHPNLRPRRRTRDSREEEKSIRARSSPQEKSWEGPAQRSSTRRREHFFTGNTDGSAGRSTHHNDTLNDVFHRRVTKLQKSNRTNSRSRTRRRPKQWEHGQ